MTLSEICNELRLLDSANGCVGFWCSIDGQTIWSSHCHTSYGMKCPCNRKLLPTWKFLMKASSANLFCKEMAENFLKWEPKTCSCRWFWYSPHFVLTPGKNLSDERFICSSLESKKNPHFGGEFNCLSDWKMKILVAGLTPSPPSWWRGGPTTSDQNLKNSSQLELCFENGGIATCTGKQIRPCPPKFEFYTWKTWNPTKIGRNIRGVVHCYVCPVQNRPPSQLFRPGPAQVEDGDEAHNTVGSRTATEAKCHRDLCHPSPLPVLLAITSSKKKRKEKKRTWKMQRKI